MAKVAELLHALLNEEQVDLQPQTKTQAYLVACCNKEGCEGLPEPTTIQGGLLYKLARMLASSECETLYGTDGTVYARDIVFPADVPQIPAMFKTSMEFLRTVEAPEGTRYAASTFGNYSFPALKSVKISGSVNLPTSTQDRLFSGSQLPAFETLQIGSINKPCLALARPKMFFTSAPTCNIVIYVDADKLADIPTDITSYAPFGNENATVIYKNSTTGETITE